MLTIFENMSRTEGGCVKRNKSEGEREILGVFT